MLKIWLKLVLKGRCARKSRPVLEGLVWSRRERCPMIGASSRLFKKKFLIFSIFCRSNLGPPCKLTLDGSC